MPYKEESTKAMLRARAFWASMAAVAVAAPAPAAQFDYNVGYVSAYSTNVTAVPRDARGEWINAVTAGVAYAENTETWVARLTSQVEYRNYAHDIVSDNTAYAVDGAAIWTISPRRLTWTFEDAARMVQLNPTGPDTPANRGGANTFRTGPDVFFRVGDLHTLSVGARYTNLYVNHSEVDNQGHSGTVRWLYQSTLHTTWSANLERQYVNFDNNAVNEDYSRNDAYLQLDKRFAQSQLVLLGGVTRVEPERSPDLAGSLARASWTHNITPESVFGMSTGVGYQDTRYELLSAISAPTDPLNPLAVSTIGTDAITADVYYNRYADMFFTLQSSRMEYRFRVDGRDLDFKTTMQDRKEGGARFEVNYLYSVTSTIGLFGDYLKVRFLDQARTDENSSIGIHYGYRMTRNTTLGLEARRHERRSTDPNAEYVDNRYLLSILYSTGTIRLPTAQP